MSNLLYSAYTSNRIPRLPKTRASPYHGQQNDLSHPPPSAEVRKLIYSIQRAAPWYTNIFNFDLSMYTSSLRGEGMLEVSFSVLLSAMFSIYTCILQGEL